MIYGYTSRVSSRIYCDRYSAGGDRKKTISIIESLSFGGIIKKLWRQKILAIDGVTNVITKRQSLHVNYRANGIEDARSIIIDSHTSNRDNIGVGETAELISGKSTISVAISGVFDNDSIPTDGHGTLHFDAPLEYAPEALFHELYPEIASFDYSWSIVSDSKKADYGSLN